MASSSHSPDVASGWRKTPDDQIATAHSDQPHGAHRLRHTKNQKVAQDPVFQPETPTDRHPTTQDASVRTSARRRGPKGFLTGRGAVAMSLFATSAACVTGFLMTSAAIIPAMAGWFLALSSLAVATVIRERDKLIAVWQAPLVMALVIAVLGQITLLGTSPTMAREVSMFFAAMASAAPAQVAAVGGAFLVVRWRFPRQRSHPRDRRLESSTS